MRYNFKRLCGNEWIRTIEFLKRRGCTFLEVKNSEDLYIPNKVSELNTVYYYRTLTSCKIIYYTWDTRWHKNLKEISFSPREIDVKNCVATFQRIAKQHGESIHYEVPNKVYTNGVYTYYNSGYKGYATSLDMNSAYLYVLTQPLADYTTKTELGSKYEVLKKEYDYYCFENELHCEMFYKEDKRMIGAFYWQDCKVYGYKGKVYFKETAKELYRLKTEVDKERYKNVPNIFVGCMHKRSGKRNNSTLAASLYAWFAWYIDSLVSKFEEKGYKVISITTDCVKIKGKYNSADEVVKIGNGLGEFKIEYEGEAQYISVGHYIEDKTKWKGKPMYIIKGNNKCTFIENPKEEREIYEEFAIF